MDTPPPTPREEERIQTLPLYKWATVGPVPHYTPHTLVCYCVAWGTPRVASPQKRHCGVAIMNFWKRNESTLLFFISLLPFCLPSPENSFT